MTFFFWKKDNKAVRNGKSCCNRYVALVTSRNRLTRDKPATKRFLVNRKPTNHAQTKTKTSTYNVIAHSDFQAKSNLFTAACISFAESIIYITHMLELSPSFTVRIESMRIQIAIFRTGKKFDTHAVAIPDWRAPRRSRESVTWTRARRDGAAGMSQSRKSEERGGESLGSLAKWNRSVREGRWNAFKPNRLSTCETPTFKCHACGLRKRQMGAAGTSPKRK